jgi:hypothetical protein
MRYDFKIGDLVEVKKDNDLNPSLRFFHNKQGMIIKKQSETHNSIAGIFVEWKILFSDQKTAIFKDYELNLITSGKKNKGEKIRND